MGNMPRMDIETFVKTVEQKYGKSKAKRWTNYPNSIFFYKYDDEITGISENIGIYTNETTYGIGPS